MQGIRNDLRIQAVAVKGLQEVAEAYLVGLFEDSNLLCYPCKMSHHYAKRCTVSKKNTQREDLDITWSVTKTWSFSGPPTYSQSKYIYLKNYLSAFSTI